MNKQGFSNPGSTLNLYTPLTRTNSWARARTTAVEGTQDNGSTTNDTSSTNSGAATKTCMTIVGPAFYGFCALLRRRQELILPHEAWEEISPKPKLPHPKTWTCTDPDCFALWKGLGLCGAFLVGGSWAWQSTLPLILLGVSAMRVDPHRFLVMFPSKTRWGRACVWFSWFSLGRGRTSFPN